MNYNFIVNPSTKKKISINSKKGKNILKKYINNLRGGGKKRIHKNSIKNKLIKNIKKDVYAKLTCTPFGIGVKAIKPIPKGVNPFKTVRKCWDGFQKIDADKVKFTKEMWKYLFNYYYINDDNNKLNLNRNGPNMFTLPIYVNHSKKPNLKAVESSKCFLEFVTIRKIKKNEILTADYRLYDFIQSDLKLKRKDLEYLK